MVADFHDLCQQIAETRNLINGLKTTCSGELKGSKGGSHVEFHLDVVTGLNAQADVARSAETLMFRAHDCDENTQMDAYARRLPFFRSVYSSVQQTVMSSPEQNHFCNRNDLEIQELFVGYVQAFCDVAGTKLKSTALGSIHIHASLVNT